MYFTSFIISKSYFNILNTAIITNFNINFIDPIITADSATIIIIAINFRSSIMDKDMNLNFINYRAIVVVINIIVIIVIGIIIATTIVTAIVTTIFMVIMIIVVIIIRGFIIIEITTITVITVAIKSITALLFNLNCTIKGTNYFTNDKNIID